jgi:hypothetical protein
MYTVFDMEGDGEFRAGEKRWSRNIADAVGKLMHHRHEVFGGRAWRLECAVTNSSVPSLRDRPWRSTEAAERSGRDNYREGFEIVSAPGTAQGL